MKLFLKSRTSFAFNLIIWLLALGVGMSLAMKYVNTSGKSGASPPDWPADSRIKRNPQLPTLVMMVHPKCPCSRASISELALLMTQEQGQMNVEVVFVKPAGLPEKWEQTDLWQSTMRLPGVQLRVDDGTEARRFGSFTSGQVMLYGTNGQLLFDGGLTSSRGHTGDNDGSRSIRSLLKKGTSEISNTPVFGCSLFNDDSSDKLEDAVNVKPSK
jgi:hypothetical protein